MNLRAARAEPGAVQPQGHVSFSEAGRGWNVRWRATSQAQNPVKSPRQDFSTFLGAGARAAHEFLKTRHCHAHHSAVLSSLAQIDPVSVAAHIERSLGELNPSDVVTHVRPNLVRALSTIAFNSSTFSIGARLLLRVATAEEGAASSMTHPLRGA